MAKKLKYLDLDTLKKINYVSDKLLKYNRTISDAVLNTIPDGLFMVVVPMMVHEHRAGAPTDPHMRCRIYDGTDRFLLLDIEMGLYDLLPEHSVPDEPDSDDVQDENVNTLNTTADTVAQ